MDVDCPRTIVHVIFTLSILYGQFFGKIVYEIWAIEKKYCPRNVEDPKILHGDNKLIRDYKISE